MKGDSATVPDKAASIARATKKRKSTERMRMAELARAIEGAFDKQIVEAGAVHDGRGYVGRLEFALAVPYCVIGRLI